MFEQTAIAIVATIIASFTVPALTSSGFFRYFLEVFERLFAGKEFPLYECLGGIVAPIHDPHQQQVDMNDVPDGLYQRALNMARVQVSHGMVPRFDLKVMGRRDVYWIHAGQEGPVHVLSFFRRPRLFRSS